MSKKGKRVGVRIDMTPFVDVAFLLLIFYMCTTSFKPPDPVRVTLPSSHVEIQVPESNVLVLGVQEDGLMVLQTGLSAAQADTVDLSALEILILQKRIANPRLRMAVKADRNVPFGIMSDVMKVLQKTNTTRFNLVTELEQDNEQQAATAPAAAH